MKAEQDQESESNEAQPSSCPPSEFESQLSCEDADQPDGYWIKMGERVVVTLNKVLHPNLAEREKKVTAEYFGSVLDDAYKVGIKLGELKQRMRPDTESALRGDHPDVAPTDSLPHEIINLHAWDCNCGRCPVLPESSSPDSASESVGSLACTECPYVFTAAEIAAEDKFAWGHPCHGVGTVCESFRKSVEDEATATVDDLVNALSAALNERDLLREQLERVKDLFAESAKARHGFATSGHFADHADPFSSCPYTACVAAREVLPESSTAPKGSEGEEFKNSDTGK